MSQVCRIQMRIASTYGELFSRLLGDQQEGHRWDGALPALAADNLQAIAVQSGIAGHGEAETAKRLFALLSKLNLASAHLVGAGSMAVPVAEFASKHPERVESLVLIGPPDPLVLKHAETPLLEIEDLLEPRNEPARFADTVAAFIRGTGRT